jgi:hypothetical protein
MFYLAEGVRQFSICLIITSACLKNYRSMHLWSIMVKIICTNLPLDTTLPPSILERFLLCDLYFVDAAVISLLVQSVVAGCCTPFKIKSQC